MDRKTTRILLIEDDPADADYIVCLLSGLDRHKFSIEWFQWLQEGLARIDKNGIDLILLDLHLPDSKGFETVLSATIKAPQLPIIVLSGLNDEALALEAVKCGAQDYIIKGQYETGSLVRSILYSIERKRLLIELSTALSKVKSLSGLLPICASCKKIRDDQGYWQQVEQYIRDHSQASFSHGLCPGCAGKLYPDIYNRIKNRKAMMEKPGKR